MSPTSPSRSDQVSLLADPTRRRICSILTDPDPPIAERDLAGELATRCLDKSAAEVTGDERRRYRIRLHHHHLPKLADYGLVDYARSTHTVRITPAGRQALRMATNPQPEPARALTAFDC